ncbi:Aste57867_18904 [Aphanomyces stellatus]|uniref:Aste57867_18904 protein n=1 Tax=Aphanomyces stellatus TaxID=120398 RepID=A0A485LBI6_9STRA|nr:hypothetical protein As57867_018840 [Aphanomyces stellatus]VFT95636.1 Aste57867_18904 [Aphanomyces stellatus]
MELQQQSAQDGRGTSDAASMSPPVDAENAKLLHKRKLTREKMKRYRNGIMRKSRQLQALAESLTQDIVALKKAQSPWVLSWDDVACALREDVASEEFTNAILQAQVRSQEHLVQTMRTWVQRCLVIPGATWRNVTLLADVTARKHGFDWITLNLHHNTDFVFDRYQFPSIASGESIQDAFADARNPDCLEYVWRFQAEIAAPFDRVCRHINLGFFDTMLMHGPKVHAPLAVDTQVLRSLGGSIRYSNSTAANEQLNHLFRIFRSNVRCVLVAQNIHDDELLKDPKHRPASNRVSWMVVDKLSPTRTSLRYLMMASQGFSADGALISLDDEAKIFGIDLSAYTEDTKLPVFVSKATQLCLHYGAEFHGILHSMGIALADGHQ